jgi:intermediate peptidase
MLSRTARHVLPTLSGPFVGFQSFHGKRQASSPSTNTVPTIPASVDDKILVSLFDQPTLGAPSSPLSPTGLFGHRSINHPQSLISLANATLIRARLLTKRILRARQSRSELLKVVKNLDRLSDMLCGVIDLAELVRNAHPERVWVEYANNAYEMLCESMNVLNTHVGLYDVCRWVIH